MSENEETPVIEEDQLPDGWRWMHLGDIAQLHVGDVPDGSTLLLSAGDAELWVSDKGLDDSDLPVSGAIPAAIVLIAFRSKLLARKIVITPWISGDGFDPAYLAYLLTGAERNVLPRYSTSTKARIPRITFKTLIERRLLRPPFDEQHRIVAKLRDDFRDRDAEIAALKRAEEYVTHHRNDVLAAIAEGRIVTDQLLKDRNDVIKEALRLILKNFQHLIGEVTSGAQEPFSQIVSLLIAIGGDTAAIRGDVAAGANRLAKQIAGIREELEMTRTTFRSDESTSETKQSLLLKTANQPTEDRYIFRRESDVWHMQFGTEHASFSHSVNFEVFAKLLADPRREMDSLELSSPGADVEREKRSMRITPKDTEEYDEAIQTGVADNAVDDETIKAVRQHIEDLRMELQAAEQEHDMERIEEVKAELVKCQEYLRTSTRDEETMDQMRSRTLGDPTPTEKARKKITNAISRGKADIEEKMPGFAAYLERTVTKVRLEAKWVYRPDDEIHWEFA